MIRIPLALSLCAVAWAQAQPSMELPKPQTEGGKPLMQALKARSSSREFSAEQLSPQVLSNLLWAAWGVNRPDGRRTAPSASNRQEIDVYVATSKALYRYDAKAHALATVVEGDLRAAAATQEFARTAAIQLVYVADFARMGGKEPDKVFYSAADTGFVSQNVYLFCASEGLATVVRASVNRAALGEAMKLRPDQKITLAQSVGYPRR